MDTLPGPRVRGGLVIGIGDKRFFVAADVAVKLAPRPQIAHLPGAPPGLLGLALCDGSILPVLDVGLDVGQARGAMVVCIYRGEHLGLLGADPQASGVFAPGEDGGVVVDGAPIPPLNLEELYAGVHTVTWGSGWGM
jgi:hypothetical protein